MNKKRVSILTLSAVVLSAAIVTAYTSFGSHSSASDNNAAKSNAIIQSFSDVNESDWFYSDVGYVSENELMAGTGDGKFSPYNKTTRGMIVTILWRLDGEEVEKGKQFDDVASDAYYHDAVSWASNHNIVSGYDEKTFAPDDAATREQLMTIMYRYAEYKNYDLSKKSDLMEYKDKLQISGYALDAMQWGHANGLITGTSDDTLSPQDFVQRCQVAAILNRFCNQFGDSAIKENNTETTVNPIEDEADKTTDNDNKKPSSGGSSGNQSSDNNSSNTSEGAVTSELPVITVDSVTAKPGDEVQVKVSISNNPGILGMVFTAYFDESALTLESAENGEAFKDVLDMTTSKTLASETKFMWDGIEVTGDSIKNGLILTMNFKVSNGANGRYPINLKYTDGDVVDNDLTPVTLQVEDGFITIN